MTAQKKYKESVFIDRQDWTSPKWWALDDSEILVPQQCHLGELSPASQMSLLATT